MMPCNALKLSSLEAVERSAAAGGGTSSGGGFVADLAAEIEKKTGKAVDPQELANWLDEHSDDDPAIAGGDLLSLLSQLLEPPVVTGSAVRAPAGELGKDPAVLLGRLVAASGEPACSTGTANKPAVGMLLAALRAGGQGGEALSESANAAPSAAAFQQLLHGAGSAAAAGPAVAAIDNRAGFMSLPVAQAGFGQAVGERLLWMVQNEVHHARLQLNPPGLGPLDIAVSLQDDRISVALNAHHALTREVLAADAPRLRAQLADAGFTAVDVNVSHDQGRGDHPSSRTAPDGFSAVDPSAVPEAVTRAQSEGSMARGRSLVDHYA